MEPMKPTVEEMKRLLDSELSIGARVAYVALLLVSLIVTVSIASLWMTERALPLRTQIAFAVMIAIGIAWIAYAAWVLTKRRVLLAGHRILAARMAVTFTSVFALGALALALQGARGAFGAAFTGALMVCVAIAMLVQAKRRFADLVRRRAELEAMR
jgi:hypothetical protein